jgi:hypothetical protein
MLTCSHGAPYTLHITTCSLVLSHCHGDSQQSSQTPEHVSLFLFYIHRLRLRNISWPEHDPTNVKLIQEDTLHLEIKTSEEHNLGYWSTQQKIISPAAIIK